MTLFLTLLVTEPVPLEAHTRNTIASADTIATTRRPLLSRLSAALKVATASLRRPRLTGWDMSDVRTQERDPLGELTRHLTPPPIGF